MGMGFDMDYIVPTKKEEVSEVAETETVQNDKPEVENAESLRKDA